MTWERSGLDVPFVVGAHPPLSDRVLEDALDSIGRGAPEGYCVACGVPKNGVQHCEGPLRCGHCGHLTVYGAEKILVYDGTREGGTL